MIVRDRQTYGQPDVLFIGNRTAEPW